MSGMQGGGMGAMQSGMASGKSAAAGHHCQPTLHSL